MIIVADANGVDTDMATGHIGMPKQGVEGRFEARNGDDAYCISNYDRLPPFLMSVVSDSDHWMYLSSGGGITAGRVDEENACSRTKRTTVSMSPTV
jgi:hypothetical protein